MQGRRDGSSTADARVLVDDHKVRDSAICWQRSQFTVGVRLIDQIVVPVEPSTSLQIVHSLILSREPDDPLNRGRNLSPCPA